jgi:hypothetical protein
MGFFYPIKRGKGGNSPPPRFRSNACRKKKEDIFPLSPPRSFSPSLSLVYHCTLPPGFVPSVHARRHLRRHRQSLTPPSTTTHAATSPPVCFPFLSLSSLIPATLILSLVFSVVARLLASVSSAAVDLPFLFNLSLYRPDLPQIAAAIKCWLQ